MDGGGADRGSGNGHVTAAGPAHCSQDHARHDLSINYSDSSVFPSRARRFSLRAPRPWARSNKRVHKLRLIVDKQIRKRERFCAVHRLSINHDLSAWFLECAYIIMQIRPVWPLDFGEGKRRKYKVIKR